MSGGRHQYQDKESTLYVGNLDERVTDKLVWELLIQAGPVVNVHLPRDRVTQTHQGFGFVEMGSEVDADYAAALLNGTKLFHKPIRINKANADKRATNEPGGMPTASVGAELFIGNLDPVVDEKMLYNTFERFGTLISPPKISRDDNNLSKGFGFVSYDSFEASDAAIQNMHGQYFMNKEITVQYAYKKDGKGERHGDAAERALAAQAKAHGVRVQAAPLPITLTSNNVPVAPANPNNRPPYMPPGMPGYPPGYPQPGYPQPGYGMPPPGMPPPMMAPPMMAPAGFPPMPPQQSYSPYHASTYAPPPAGFPPPQQYPMQQPQYPPPGHYPATPQQTAAYHPPPSQP